MCKFEWVSVCASECVCVCVCAYDVRRSMKQYRANRSKQNKKLRNKKHICRGSKNKVETDR